MIQKMLYKDLIKDYLDKNLGKRYPQAYSKLIMDSFRLTHKINYSDSDTAIFIIVFIDEDDPRHYFFLNSRSKSDVITDDMVRLADMIFANPVEYKQRERLNRLSSY